MIYVNRAVHLTPKILDPTSSPAVQKEMADAKRFFGNAERNRGQKRFNFSVALDRSVKLALRELFHSKCAYCEVKLDRISPMQKYGINGDIEHYRPKSSVLEAPDHPGYWWLAADWNNLLIACHHCNRGSSGNAGKANRFPLIDEKTRVTKPTQDIIRESPLLLNPCVDTPEYHLVFADDGQVFSETERGKATILVIGLNRESLIRSRLEVINHINELHRLLAPKLELSRNLNLSIAERKQNNIDILRINTELQELTEPSQEFAGLKRQYVRSGLESAEIAKGMAPSNLETQSRKITKKEQKQVKKAYQSYTKNLEGISLSSNRKDKKSYLLLNHYIDKIELRNIKTFRHQVFDLTTSNEGTAPWMMFLGENGSGKSTVLKSISLNLSDRNYFQKLIDKGLVHPNKFIRHRCKMGSIKIWLSGMSNPRTLELRKDHYTFTSSTGEVSILQPSKTPLIQQSTSWSAQTFLLGYGATRLLPRGNGSEEDSINSDFVRVDNLFNPFVPLGNAERWLLGLDAKLFRRAALIFKDLLNMGEDEDLQKAQDRILVNINGSKVPFDELSDGYQSVVALTADVLQLVMTEWKNPDEARGIVMLDEVGAHLHPQWKMKIVGSLRKALPHMQFIVSSHQPLCLRGLGKGEVMILRRDEEKRVEVLTDLPNPKELRISQILTSVFGLSSTLDPELEAEYKRYYELRAMHNRSVDEQEELSQLEDVLRPDLMMGDTLLDTQTYKVVKEQYKEYKKKDDQSDLESLSDSTISAVQALWAK